MPDRPNFLLGYGERLTEPIPPIGSQGKKYDPYGVSEARDRLAPMLSATVSEFDSLPEHACPRDEAVAAVTLHPQFFAKSFYPSRLLRAVGLETIGSRPKVVTPQKWTRRGAPEPSESTDLFVAAPRETFRRWAATLARWTGRTPGAGDLPRLEQVRALTVADRLRPIPDDVEQPLLEIVLHAAPGGSADYIVDAFREFARDLDASVDLDRRFYAGRLCFVPVRAHRSVLRSLAQFSYLRVARQMPSLRPLTPIVRSWSGARPFSCALPDEGPVDSRLHVAVFDGGVADTSELRPWVIQRDAGNVGGSVEEYVHHGTSVTSALLFGPLHRREQVERPFAVVDHYRVLDGTSGRDEDLYDVLRRIRDVLQNVTLHPSARFSENSAV